MKNLLYLILFISFCSVAQQKVYRTKVFEKKVLNPSDMRKQYPSVSIIRTDDEKNAAILTDVMVKKLINDFQIMAKKQGKAFHKYNETRSIPVSLLVMPDGTIEYFTYGYKDSPALKNMPRNIMFSDSLNSENTAKLESFAEYFISHYKLSKGLSANKYSIDFSLNVGPSPKKPSKMYIWNIEMAVACDKPDTVKTLLLNNLYLESFPEVVFRFRNLEKLDLSNNFIEKVPGSVSAISNLKFLSISNNPINNHKLKFKKNTHLKDLNIQYTGINMIPRSLARNRQLEVLFLGNNRFDKFRKRDFKQLDSLKALNLYNAGLKEVPNNVMKLRKLEELDLYYNDLKKLPNEICDMPALKTLAVSNNELWSLPVNLAKLKTLKTLYAHHNRLTELPVLPDLELLHVGHNLFKTFPEQVYQLENLVEFDITHNQIREIPGQLRKFQKLQRVFIEGNDFVRLDSKKEELTKLVTDLEKKDILVR